MASIFDFFRKKDVKVSTEQYPDSSAWVRNLLAGGIGGIKDKFMTDIYKEQIMYPHEEMLLAKKAKNNCAWLNSAVQTRANLMLGGKIEAQSKDKKTEEWINAILASTGLKYQAVRMGIDFMWAGNFYCERIYDNSGKIVYYDYISFPERMYVNLDEKGLIIDYFQEVPESLLGKTDNKSIRYYGDRRKALRGKVIPKNKLFHMKWGVAEIPCYGRGPVCSTVNDYRVLLEIERALAVIARYKAIPKKLIMLNRGDDINGGKTAEYYANQISALSDIDNPVLPEIAQIADLSYSGKDINFEPIVNYLKRKMTIALVPSFVIHGEETNYAVADSEKEAWSLQIKTDRDAAALLLKKEISLIAKTHGVKLSDYELVFGEVDFGLSQMHMNRAKDLFTSNIITLNEARAMMNLPPRSNDGDYLHGELTAATQLLGPGSVDATENDNVDPYEVKQ